MAKWKIDPAHATAQFKAKHLGIAWVPGNMYGISGEINFDQNNLSEAKFVAEIDASTLTTGLEQRDMHLKGADFFDVENHPKIKFESSNVESSGENSYLVKGNLTIKGISKEVTLEVVFMGETVKFNQDGTSSTVSSFSTETQIDRRDFGITWNIDLPGGNLLVGNEVVIDVNLEAIKIED